MTPRRLTGELLHNHEMPDYREQVMTMAVEEELPERALSERGLQLTVDLLEEIYHRHGDPNSDSYKHYHNDQHALNVIRRCWRLWKPLHDKLPGRFDTRGFELLMIAAAGHDIINDPDAAREQPGQNERASADFVSQWMFTAGYDESDIERVSDAIIKTTVERDGNGVVVQTEMQTGSKDITGLILGQADMNGILIEGPSALFSDPLEIYLEFTEAPLRHALRNPAGFTRFLLDESNYLQDRVNDLPEHLAYFVENPEEQEIIKQIYWQKFHGTSFNALQAAQKLQHAPESTRKMVEASFDTANRLAQHGIARVIAAKRYLINRHNSDKPTI